MFKLKVLIVLLPIVIRGDVETETFVVSCDITNTCKNNGACIEGESEIGTTFEYCLCPGGWKGPTCEVEVSCDLPCENNGYCKFPQRLPAVHDQHLPQVIKPHCECDRAFSGKICEFENDSCGPDGDLECYNGGSCRPYSGSPEDKRHDNHKDAGTKYTCDCSVIDKANPHVGHQCEHAPARSCSLLTKYQASFCVNGGTCKDMTTVEGLHLGCHCLDAFEGEHCEFSKNKKSNKEPDMPSSNQILKETVKSQQGESVATRLQQGGIIVGSMIVVCCALIMGHRLRRSQPQLEIQVINDASNPTDGEISVSDNEII